MKKNGILLLLTLGLLHGAVEQSFAQTTISLDDPNLHYDGAFYNVESPTLVTFNRHSPTIYNNTESGIYGTWIYQWVITQTGIRIRFKTSSPSIKFTFQQRSGGGTIGVTPTNGFGVFADSVFIESFSSLIFTINNPNPGNSTFYEVTLPNLWAVDLIGMELATAYSLDNPGVLAKPVYAALGDSKTHGTGQYVATHKTYPFLLASLMKWDLHNMAVAGSSTGWAMALNVKGKQVDKVTMEFGYNDWKYLSESLASRQTQYGKLIDSLRCYLPNANIYCITPIVTTDVSGAAPYTIEDFRTMVERIVNLRKQIDSKLFLIPGPSVSDFTMLASGDPVHLSESGAQTLADNLKGAIDDPSSVLTEVSLGNTTVQKTLINSISSTQMNVTITNSGCYSFELFSTDGKPMVVIENVFLHKGQNEIYWNASGLGNGCVYVVRIQQGELTEGAQFMLMEK
jgi:lysophospholipase L1-like esterase